MAPDIRYMAILAVCSIWAVSSAHALEIHVSPSGCDSNDGTAQAPLQTPEAARNKARPFVGKEPVSILFEDGIYYLEKPLTFDHEDSGTEKAPVIYKSANEGKAVFSGGLPLQLRWEEAANGIFQAKTPAGLALDQLFVNGERQPMARYPNYDPAKKTIAYRGAAPDAFSADRAARWADPAGGYIHAMHAHLWGGYHYLITGKNDKGEVTYAGGWQNNRPLGMHKDLRMVENIREELDAPGEWFHDSKAGALHFMPPAGLDLAKATVEGVRLANLVSFRGTQEKPVRFVSMDGIVFRHSARTFMNNKEPLLRSDWTICRGGALFFEGSEDCALRNCFIDQPGGNAVFVNKYNRRLLFSGMHVFGSGASAFAFVGDPKAVRNPVFGYGSPHDIAKIDLTPGPLTEDYPMDCVVEDSLIHEVGTVEKQGAGVQISMSRRILVRHCSIYDTSRAGININEGTWGGHLIEGCDVFNTVQETGDHGSFNSWGRDRYWLPTASGVPDSIINAVKANPRLPFLDAIETTVIRNSRWRCDHGWDIDLDDGSSNYEIRENLLLRGGLKLREGYRRLVINNILVGNTLFPHVWFPESGDVFRGNIVMAAYRPAVMRAPKWGEEINRNLFTTNHRDRTRFADKGCDQDSIVADPRFADPKNGDFTVRNAEAAAAIGFKNFPMEFGVRKPSLKAIARTPETPNVQVRPDPKPVQLPVEKPGAFVWRDATLAEPKGEALSAYGVPFDSGGVAIEAIAASSPLAGAEGLQAGDLVQQLNGAKIRSVDDLRKAADTAKDGRLFLRVIRNQKEHTVVLQGSAPQNR